MRAWLQMTLCDWVYDLLGLCIAISDVVTDYIVTYQYYSEGLYGYFGVAVAIFVVAHTVYAGLFANEMLPWHTDMIIKLCVFVLYWPFAGTFSVVWWITGVGLCKDTLKSMGLDVDDNKKAAHNDNNDSKAEWIDHKLENHIGFVVESMLESFPMSILQMIAIVDVQEPNIVNILSIFLSMTSVGTKSIFFSYSMDSYVFAFHWICVFVDCFGIFTSIVWCFDYFQFNVDGTFDTNGQLHNENWLDDCLYYLSAIYFFKVIFITFPFSFWSFTFNTLQHGPLKFYSELCNSVDNNCDCCYWSNHHILSVCLCIFLFIIASLFSTIMVLFSIIINTMVFEICDLTFLVVAGFTLNLEIQNKYSMIAPIITFCSQAYNKMDLKLRIYIVNYCVQRQLSVNKSKLSNASLTDPVYVQTKKTLEQWMSININNFNNNVSKMELSKKSDIDIKVDTEIDLQVAVDNDKNINDKDNDTYNNKNVQFNVKDGLSMHHFRDQYTVTLVSKILSNLRGSIRAFYDEIFTGCSCFSIRSTKSGEKYIASKGFDYSYQKCGTMFLFPLYVFSCIYTVLYPILCFICFMGLLLNDNYNYSINNVSLFNKFQIGLSCVYIFGIILICLLFYKVYKFYYILWHLIYVKDDILSIGSNEKFMFFLVKHDDFHDQNSGGMNTSQVCICGDDALSKHVQFVYYNMYTMQLTVHILRQFFGPFSNIIFEMIGFTNADNADNANAYAWDLVLQMVSKNSSKYGRLIVSEHLFNRVMQVTSDQHVGVGIETVKNVQQLQKYRSEPDVYAANGKFKNSRQRSAVKDLLGFDKYIFDIV